MGGCHWGRSGHGGAHDQAFAYSCQCAGYNRGPRRESQARSRCFPYGRARLDVELSDCIVVGDSVWDILGARRAKALGVGLLCGGYSAAELEQAGTYKVYKDPADLHGHLAEIGIQVD